MLDANCISDFCYRKKKSSNYIIPASYFNKNAPIAAQKNTTAPPSSGNTSPQRAAKPGVKRPSTLPKLDPSKRRVSAFSLKNLSLDKKEVILEEEQEDLASKPKTEFTKEEFLSHWKKYISILREDGQNSLASVMDSNPPELKGLNIRLILPNNLMDEQIQRGKIGIMRYLRTELNNFSIDLITEIKEEEVKKKFIYTPEEKYARLKELNPGLEKLRHKFKLDL